MNVLQSSDTHLLFGKGLTWYKDCPKPALGHALQQHLSKPDSNLGLRDTCSPQAATLQLISDGLGSFQPFKKHTSRLQAPSNCECLFIEHSQGCCFSADCSPNLTSSILHKTCCLPTCTAGSAINTHHLYTPLFPSETGMTKALPECVAQLCALHTGFGFNLVLVAITFSIISVTPELAVGNGGNDTAFHSVQDTNNLFSSANSPSQFCLSASTPARGYHKERKKQVPPEHWNAHSSLSLHAWSVRVLSGALSPLCYLWENSLQVSFPDRHIYNPGFLWQPSQRQWNYCIQMHSSCSMQMEQKNLLFPRTVRSPKWPVWIRGPWHFSQLSLHFGGWKHPKFPVPYSHILSTLSIRIPVFIQPFSWLHFYLQTPLQLLIYLPFLF